MAEVMAGFVCGYALALALTPVAAITLVRARVSSAYLQNVVPQGTSLIAVSVIFHTFGMLTLTALGILLGLLLNGLEERSPSGGLGSPNQAFTAFIIATGAIAAGPMALYLRRWRVPLLAAGLVFACIFGWAMPYLSLLGPGQD